MASAYLFAMLAVAPSKSREVALIANPEFEAGHVAGHQARRLFGGENPAFRYPSAECHGDCHGLASWDIAEGCRNDGIGGMACSSHVAAAWIPCTNAGTHSVASFVTAGSALSNNAAAYPWTHDATPSSSA
jgi:hypothetical protein